MRSLNDDEIDEIESVKYFIKYVNLKPNVEGFKLWEAIQKLQDLDAKYIISGIVSEKELSDLLDLDDMKDVISKFMDNIINHMEKDDLK